MLSEADLDIVAPLERTYYSAPETLLGGVAAESDWWSLGMIVLEQLTRGQCFRGADPETFSIAVIARGAPIPTDLETRQQLLLRGLLARDRHDRWGWDQVQAWCRGESPAAPHSRQESTIATGPSIRLGGTPYADPADFALQAARAEHWEEAKDQLVRGVVETWLQRLTVDDSTRHQIGSLRRHSELDDDIKLGLSLRALNPAMPLVVRGSIVGPEWLLAHPDEGYRLLMGPVPAMLGGDDDDNWLLRWQARERRIRQRAQQLGVELDEARFRINVLASQIGRLRAEWDQQRQLMPDTDTSGLLAIMDRSSIGEEDLILLVSADPSQFTARETLIQEAVAKAEQVGFSLDRDRAAEWLAGPRREMFSAIDQLIQGFARTGHPQIDGWVDNFRMQRRLPAAEALVVLAVPADRWHEPPQQGYVSDLLDFYARRISAAVMRGPLTRFVIGKTTPRIDLTELSHPTQSGQYLLDHLVLRNDRKIAIPSDVLIAKPAVTSRLRTLQSRAAMYRRDTGIDGLYLGFPFLVFRESSVRVPRIAPVLLWPMKLVMEVGAQGQAQVGFDRDREEVRLNPIFPALLGEEAAQRWLNAADQALGRSSVTGSDIIDVFADLARPVGTDLVAVPDSSLPVRVGHDRLVPAAALFHVEYPGQAVQQDLQRLRSLPPTGTALELALRLAEPGIPAPERRPPEAQQYFVASSDPSQAEAVFAARRERGLVIEGPPGTGKSQTIVNTVADCIGTGRSLLVVCQKQAALEVVHKRLEAEGLGQRVLMVTDVNKDREPVLRAIREQLERLGSVSTAAPGWVRQRKQVASRVDALEASLGQHHEAMVAADVETGLTYRDVLLQLVTLADGAAPAVGAPGLRQLMGCRTPEDVVLIQDRVGPLMRYWVPARAEGSPLREVKQFDADAALIADIGTDLEQYLSAELRRDSAVDAASAAATMSDPEPYRAWLAQHEGRWRGLDDGRLTRLSRWSTLGNGRPPIPVLDGFRQRLMDDADRLRAMPTVDTAPQVAEFAVGLATPDLDAWVGRFEQLAQPASWLRRLGSRHRHAVRLVTTLGSQLGVTDQAQLGAALRYEQQIRPTRHTSQEVLTRLEPYPHNLSTLATGEVIGITDAAAAELGRIMSLLQDTAGFPEPTALAAVVASGSREKMGSLPRRHP